MRVGVIQSAYIPWRGYFDFINSVDVFIFHDDIQYTKGDWRNRNLIKTEKGLEWLTVPVHYKTVSQKILDTDIDYTKKWFKKHLRRFEVAYAKAPYLDDALDILSVIESETFDNISSLNLSLIKRICRYLSIETTLKLSSEFNLSGTKTDRLIELLLELGASTYLSGPSADVYLDKSQFIKNKISLEYKKYNYEVYPQLWGDFNGQVSIMDLIANCGKSTRQFICSKHADEIKVDFGNEENFAKQ